MGGLRQLPVLARLVRKGVALDIGAVPTLLAGYELNEDLSLPGEGERIEDGLYAGLTLSGVKESLESPEKLL